MKKKKQQKEHIIRRLMLEARPIWKWLGVAVLLCCGVIFCAVAGPKLLGNLIDRLYAYWDGSFTGNLPLTSTSGIFCSSSLINKTACLSCITSG